jgi:hypothetical protein
MKHVSNVYTWETFERALGISLGGKRRRDRKRGARGSPYPE